MVLEHFWNPVFEIGGTTINTCTSLRCVGGLLYVSNIATFEFYIVLIIVFHVFKKIVFRLLIFSYIKANSIKYVKLKNNHIHGPRPSNIIFIVVKGVKLSTTVNELIYDVPINRYKIKHKFE